MINNKIYLIMKILKKKNKMMKIILMIKMMMKLAYQIVDIYLIDL